LASAAGAPIMAGMLRPPSYLRGTAALVAVVLASAAALALAMSLRLAPGEWPAAWPTAGGPGQRTGRLLAGGLLLAAVAAAGLAASPAPDRRWRRHLLAAMCWPAVPLAAAWLALPAAGPPTLRTLWLLPALVLAAWLLGRRGRGWLGGAATAASAGARRGLLEGRLWRWAHPVVLVAGAAAGLAAGGFGDTRALLLSAVLYPLYALVQLALALAIPWPWLRRLAPGRGVAAGAAAGVTAAAVFALVHWPNPVVMVLTAGGMLVWAHEYARGRPLWHLALSMGLLATVAAQGLPDAWTEHMRTGPGAVRQRAVAALATAAAARTDHLPAGRSRALALLAELYPATVGRHATQAELARWWRSLQPCRRAVLAWRFFISEEYRRKSGGPAGEAPLPGDVHWTDLPAPWPGRIGAFAASPAAADPDGDADAWTTHLHRLYREILRREPAPAELAAWSPALSPRQQQRLVEVLLERRGSLARTPFDTLGCRGMRLHH